jgi:hypothetical protein
MKTITISALSLGLALFAGACSEDEGGSGKSYDQPIQPNESQKQSAQTAVTSVDDMKGLAATDPGNEQAITKVTGVWGNLQNLTAAKTAAQAGQAGQGAGATPGMAGVPSGATTGGLATAEGALTEGCYAQNGSAVSYNDCAFGGGTIDGTIDYAEPNLDIDLTIALTQGAQMTIVEQGSLTLATDAITGQLSYTADIESLGGLGGLAGAGGAATDYSSTTTVDAMYDIQLTDGCPTGGTLEVHQVTSVSGVPGGAGTHDVWVKAEFGPNCGDVTLY